MTATVEPGSANGTKLGGTVIRPALGARRPSNESDATARRSWATIRGQVAGLGLAGR